MDDELEEKITSAIGKMADMAKGSQQDSQKALHYSQAALNLAHTAGVLNQVKSGSGNKKSN